MPRMGKIRGAWRVLVGKPEEKKSLARPRRRRVDDITELKYIGSEGMEEIYCACFILQHFFFVFN